MEVVLAIFLGDLAAWRELALPCSGQRGRAGDAWGIPHATVWGRWVAFGMTWFFMAEYDLFFPLHPLEHLVRMAKAHAYKQLANRP